MERTSRNYQAIRDSHNQALDALHAAADQQKQPSRDAGAVEQAPARPEGQYRQSPSWTHEGGMAQQQASANNMVKANHEHRQALDALHQNADRADAGKVPEKTPDIDRSKGPDIER